MEVNAVWQVRMFQKDRLREYARAPSADDSMLENIPLS